MTAWVEKLCAIAFRWKTGNASIRMLFEAASPELTNRDEFLGAVAGWLRQHPELIDEWYGYAVDKRVDRGPYFKFGDEGGCAEVGFYDPDRGYLDVMHHSDPADACADFLWREANWILRRERVS